MILNREIIRHAIESKLSKDLKPTNYFKTVDIFRSTLEFSDLFSDIIVRVCTVTHRVQLGYKSGSCHRCEVVNETTYIPMNDPEVVSIIVDWLCDRLTNQHGLIRGV